MESGIQLSIEFTAPTFDELLKVRQINDLEIVESSRMKRGWYVRIHTHKKMRELTIPKYLSEAPFDIKMALIDWATLPSARTRKQKSDICKFKMPLENQIQHYIQSIHPSKLQIKYDPTKKKNRSIGTIFDLKDIFDSINKRYFDSTIQAFCRWGTHASTTSYQTTRSLKDGTRINLITIAGVYDHPDVPRFALEAVMFHEMLHIHIPPFKKSGKNIIHGSEFKKAERAFELYEPWRKWEREHLRAIARKMRVRKGS
jgi:hypothetical protein